MVTEIQIVDQEQNFGARIQDWISETWEFKNHLDTYKIISVMGPQSSGKSTLLNKVFGTRFPVMKEQSREQTTRGMWISQAKGAPYLILDVEGTDGRERGENQGFERKSALFSLAVSQVMIINVWENNIGLYNGSNMALLKIVFEVNLQMFKKQAKTLLVFAIRDFLGTTPFESLKATLMADIRQLWMSLTRPSGTNFQDFFDLEFFALPHKVLRESEFSEQAQNMKTMFYNSQDPNHVFNRDLAEPVPIDGLEIYLASIWKTIQTNRDLDIPTQQELVAQFRCDEISETVYSEFARQIDQVSRDLQNGKPIDGFGHVIGTLWQETIDGFSTLVKRYNVKIVQKKSEELDERISELVKSILGVQLKNLHRASIQIFITVMDQTSKELSYSSNVKQAKEKACSHFLRGLETSKISGKEWKLDAQYEEFVQEIQERSGQVKKSLVERVVRESAETVKVEAGRKVSEVLEETENIWSTIFDGYASRMEAEAGTMKQLIDQLDLELEEWEEIERGFVETTWNGFVERLEDETRDRPMMDRLRKRFTEAFRYAGGLPRVWTSVGELDKDYRDSTEKVRVYLEKVSAIETAPNSKWIPLSSSMTLIDKEHQEELLDRFSKEQELAFLEAKRSIVRKSKSIPPWVLFLLILLGWNELVAILSSPLYFSLSLVGIILYYSIWVLGLCPFIETMFWQLLDRTRDLGTRQLDQRGIDK